jgi:hypothetical protein
MRTIALTVAALSFAMLLAAPPAGCADTKRTVSGQVLTSTEMPAVRIKFDPKFAYIGGQDFILYDVARAEQHFFVDADEQKRVKRFYWIQFEGYLPSNTHSYDYDSKTKATLGGLEFVADAFPVSLTAPDPRPDSDGARARAYLASKGYKMAGDELLLQRLVHLVDAAKRNELMIIYIEDLGGTGLTAEALAPGGANAARWPEMSKALLERATKGIEISR